MVQDSNEVDIFSLIGHYGIACAAGDTERQKVLWDEIVARLKKPEPKEVPNF